MNSMTDVLRKKPEAKELELIEVCLEKEEYVFCGHCDGESRYVNRYYRFKDRNIHIRSFQRYLDCCKDLVGVVVDWEAK